jgi:hypothetical protein
MSVDVARAGEIAFRKGGQETPRRRARDVQAVFNNSRLTLELKELAGGALSGKTEFAGDLAIRRDALKSLKFNLYD